MSDGDGPAVNVDGGEGYAEQASIGQHHHSKCLVYLPLGYLAHTYPW